MRKEQIPYLIGLSGTVLFACHVPYIGIVGCLAALVSWRILAMRSMGFSFLFSILTLAFGIFLMSNFSNLNLSWNKEISYAVGVSVIVISSIFIFWKSHATESSFFYDGKEKVEIGGDFEKSLTWLGGFAGVILFACHVPYMEAIGLLITLVCWRILARKYTSEENWTPFFCFLALFIGIWTATSFNPRSLLWSDSLIRSLGIFAMVGVSYYAASEFFHWQEAGTRESIRHKVKLPDSKPTPISQVKTPETKKEVKTMDEGRTEDSNVGLPPIDPESQKRFNKMMDGLMLSSVGGEDSIDYEDAKTPEPQKPKPVVPTLDMFK